ncbi:MAG: hypothetical protein ACK5XX_04590 [Holosporales bacterium]|jgi:hypothetical protein|nr:hypothetical protein [Thalassospira sp.]
MSKKSTPATKNPKKITVEQFDALFDSGSDDIDAHLDWDNARPWREAFREESPGKRFVGLSLPEWLYAELEKNAAGFGLTVDQYLAGFVAHNAGQLTHAGAQLPTPPAPIMSTLSQWYSGLEFEKNFPEHSSSAVSRLAALVKSLNLTQQSTSTSSRARKSAKARP